MVCYSFRSEEECKETCSYYITEPVLYSVTRPGEGGAGLPPTRPGEGGAGLPPKRPGEGGAGLPPKRPGEGGAGLPPVNLGVLPPVSNTMVYDLNSSILQLKWFVCIIEKNKDESVKT